MDVVVTTYAPDLKLLRHAVASYDLYWRTKASLVIVTAHEDEYLLSRIAFPSNTRFVFREDFPELSGIEPFRQQLYLKLQVHQFVESDDFVMLDSDFILLNSVCDADYYHNGRPVWFYRCWRPGDPVRARWSLSADFLGFDVPYAFLDTPQWVLKREVCRALAAQYDLRRFLHEDNLSEFLVYGAFAHKFFQDHYEFVDRESDSQHLQLAGKVNQIPPTFLQLDPDCRYEDYAQFRYVAFWSHWELAERKMVDFFHASQLAHFGQVIRASDEAPLLPVIAPGPFRPEWSSCAEGLASDGWMNDQVHFSIRLPSIPSTVIVDVMVPEHPSLHDWRLSGQSSACASACTTSFELSPGERSIEVAATQATNLIATVSVSLGAGFRVPGSSDQREFRGLLRGIRVQPA